MLLMFLGLLLIAAGLLVMFMPHKEPEFGELTALEGQKTDAELKGGAVIMIGPIPLVMGSDLKTALLMMLMALAIMLIWAVGFKASK
jgi:uncharacterized protein (TIGR00304 family)